MSKKDAVVLAARVLGVLMAMWALSEVSYLPERVLELLHYSSGNSPYLRSYETVHVGFLVVRIVGFAFMSRWLLKGGPDIEETLLPADEQSAGTGLSS